MHSAPFASSLNISATIVVCYESSTLDRLDHRKTLPSVFISMLVIHCRRRARLRLRLGVLNGFLATALSIKRRILPCPVFLIYIFIKVSTLLKFRF